MPRDKFYEIPHSSWIMGQRPPDGEARGKPEEAVRQWCAFELIRAYGYKISDLEFERAVKVGSKTYRIDVLIVRDGKPFAVIECKEQGFTKHSVGMEQAISYAASREIDCEFAAYTNGQTWLVQRKVGAVWVPVTDLPNRMQVSGEGSIDELLDTVQLLSPILYKLDDPIEGDEAQVFLSALQEFFLGKNQATRPFDQHLLRSTDCVLRVLSVGMKDQHYSTTKLSGAAGGFDHFRESRGIGHPITGPFEGVDLRMIFAELGSGVGAILDDNKVHPDADTLLLRFNAALLGYGRSFAIKGGRHPCIPPEVHHTLRDVLQLGLATGFGVHLPSALELKTNSDMKTYCRSAWEETMRETTQRHSEPDRLTTWQRVCLLFRKSQ